ncbi:putative general secretion pathway protein D [Hartmannibacter diazotrophicus]|uniref:Putative general secretion pathway protein D n=1 Tax=Hartmannibacter diazotrophicus TaxID=1482074 RepID=A0A2C9D4J5_9HYPH|nr:type II and III secretion system protein family protein [Hartmannibacter diazotrophicus]SON54415.1 putative general secretion pathway protein D [Hartmannibacter diazotrophicus]
MKSMFKSLLAAAMVATALLSPVGPASAADANYLSIASADQLSGRVINLGLNKSMVIDVPEDIVDVLISNPTIADAVVRTKRKIYLIGNAVGETNIILFGQGNQQFAQFNISVARDTATLDAMIAKLIPGSQVHVETINDSVILSGTVKTPAEAGKAAEIAEKYIGSAEKIVNMVSVAESDQVHLKVVVAEVDRNIVKNLGIDTESILQNSAFALTATGSGPGGALFQNWGAEAAVSGTVDTFIQALNQQGIVRTLAEPTLTATSGESANFLVGGEFPIPVSQDNNTITVEWKQFGISLAFTPVVLTPGRISLRVKSEVSDLSTEGAITISGLTLNSLSVRRAESTVELPSGGSMVMAGLLKDNLRQQVKGFPGLMDVPILGSLFKSKEFERNQTELAIFVSPYLVKPVAPSALQRPDKNFAPPSDAKAIFLNRLNRVYSSSANPPKGSYQGKIGFMFE